MSDGTSRDDHRGAQTWVLQEVAIEVLREVAQRCSTARIEFVAVKGAVTSRLLYADVAKRPLTDVDIRIRPRDFAAFRRMAARAGWRQVGIALTSRIVVYQFAGLSVDVEAVVGPPGLCSLSVDDVISRASPTELAPGLRLLLPELHDHAIMLVINVFKDKLPAASEHALSDVERIAVHPGFSADVFVRRAIEARIATLSWIVAGAMEARGATAWGEIRRELERRGNIRYEYARRLQRLNRDADSESWRVRLLARRAADRKLMRAEALIWAFAREIERRMRALWEGI
jgi:hypothetical protein